MLPEEAVKYYILNMFYLSPKHIHDRKYKLDYLIDKRRQSRDAVNTLCCVKSQIY